MRKIFLKLNFIFVEEECRTYKLCHYTVNSSKITFIFSQEIYLTIFIVCFNMYMSDDSPIAIAVESKSNNNIPNVLALLHRGAELAIACRMRLLRPIAHPYRKSPVDFDPFAVVFPWPHSTDRTSQRFHRAYRAGPSLAVAYLTIDSH